MKDNLFNRAMRSTANMYFAVAMLVLATGVGSYVDIENDALHARHLEINTGLERMVRLNHELASMLVIAVLVLYRHKSNIQNLLSGKESKIGGSSK